MLKDYRPVWEEINLDNLIYNIRQIRLKVGKDKELIGIVKANAYGHGALEVSQVLLENGVNRLAVSELDEAIELRENGIKCPIMILGIVPDTFLNDIVDYNVEPVVPSYEYASKLSRIAKDKWKTVKIHVAVDTGMGRIGFQTNENSIEEIYNINKLSNIEIQSLFSHFSTSDEKDKTYSHKQFEKYKTFYKELMKRNVRINTKDIANSAAIMELPDTYCDAVRPGIIIYGYYPSDDIDKNQLSIKPVMSLKAKVAYVKTLDAGKYVSYGRKFKSKRKSIIATLPIGYADGYTRMLSGNAKVIVNGKFAPVVGTICMDQCMIDVTDAGEVNVGDEIILMGEKNGLKFDAEDVAKIIGTISYEVLCSISRRVPRVYIKDGKIIKIRNYLK